MCSRYIVFVVGKLPVFVLVAVVIVTLVTEVGKR